jgi:hypothetical protein
MVTVSKVAGAYYGTAGIMGADAIIVTIPELT